MQGAGTTLELFLVWLRHQRYTGTVTIHCAGGKPQWAAYGPPSRVQFSDSGLDRTPSSPARSPREDPTS